MSVLPILIYGDQTLKEVASPITEITPEHHALAQDMIDTMYHNNGIGLAANQIGVLERIIVVDVNWARSEDRENAPRKPHVMINPEVLHESVEDDVYDEGCLSIPNINGEVWRPVEIKVRHQTLEGNTMERTCTGLFARCILHEIDHLNGVLFVDRMSKAKRFIISRSLNRLMQSKDKVS